MIGTTLKARFMSRYPLAFIIFLGLVRLCLGVEQSCLLHLVRRYCDEADDLRPIIYSFSLDYTEHLLETTINHTYFVRQLDDPYVLNPTSSKCVIAMASKLSYKLDVFLRVYFFHNEFQRCRVIMIFDEKINLGKLFKKFWDNFVSDVIVVVRNFAYTYHPITQNSCEFISPVALGGCCKINADLLEGQAEYFPNCTLNVVSMHANPFISCDTFHENKGFQVMVLRVIVEKLQLIPNLRIVGCNLGFRKNKRYTVEVLLGEQHTGFHATVATAPLYISDSASLFLPKAEVVEPWKNTIRIFDVPIWALLLASVVCVTAICAFQNNRDNISSHLMFTLAVLISSIPRVPTRLRQIFAFWAISSVIIVNAYIGLLTSFLFKSTPKHQIRTLDEMVNEGYKFGGYFSRRKFFNTIGAINYSTQYYYENYIQCKFVDDQNCFDRMVKGDIVMFSYTHSMKYLLTVNNVHSIYKTPTLITDLASMMFVKSWYKDRLIQGVFRLNEFGIVQHLDRYSWKEEVVGDIGFRNLTLTHLYFIFVVCTFGLLLAFVVFLAELYRGSL